MRSGDARIILEVQCYLQDVINERKINTLPVVNNPDLKPSKSTKK